MKQEDKELLLKDLCARLPYGVKVQFYLPNYFTNSFDEKIGEVFEIGDMFTHVHCDGIDYLPNTSRVKPYLRPMSSLIGKELDECRATCKYRQAGQSVLDCATPQTIDYLISHHFDYRGLIPMGIALEAPEEMYNTSPKWTSLRSGLKENEDGQIVGGLKL